MRDQRGAATPQHAGCPMVNVQDPLLLRQVWRFVSVWRCSHSSSTDAWCVAELLQPATYAGFSSGTGENEPTGNREGSVNFCDAILPLSVACVSARADAGGAHCSTEGQS